MTKFYKLLDELINSIPDSVLFLIRLCALGLWFIVALFVGINSWYKGTYSVYEMRDGLPNLKEEVFRENNRAKPSKPFISDVDKFAGISRNTTIRSNEKEKERESLRYPIVRQDTSERREIPIVRQDTSEIRETSIERQNFSSAPSFRSNPSLLLEAEEPPSPNASPSFRSNPSLLLEAEEPPSPNASPSFHSSATNLNLLPVDE